MTNNQDYIASLPTEVSSYILSFLDLKSLLACCAVNEVWDEITNHLPSKTWFEACLKAGIYVKRDKYTEAKDWKAFAYSTQERVRDRQDTSVIPYEFDEPITAMYCHGERVAVAFINRIQIWNLPYNESVGEFECKFEPLRLKFDDNTLVAASRSGVLSCWSLTSGKNLWQERFYSGNTILTDFDFLTSHDIVVGGFCKNDILSHICRIRSLENLHTDARNVVSTNLQRIEKMMLVPHPDHPVSEQEKACLLFCLTTHYVLVSEVKLQNGTIAYGVEGMFIIDSIPPPLSSVQRVIIDKLPGGLQFDGETVYILAPTPPACSRTIWAWNWNTNSKCYIESGCPIMCLLGVGEKCLVYEIRQQDDRELVTAVDKVTKKTISQFSVPRRTRLKTDDYLCLGNTSWLDSVNRENSCGVVYASITDDRLGVYVRRFVPTSE